MRREGIILADAMVGLGIIAVAAGLVALSVARYNRAADRLGEQRQLYRFAEQALYHMQTGQAPPRHEAWRLSVTPIEDRTSINDHTWWRVEVAGEHTRATLFGLAPSNAPGTGGGP